MACSRASKVAILSSFAAGGVATSTWKGRRVGGPDGTICVTHCICARPLPRLRTSPQHPAILEAAVIGTADARWGEVGHAHILLRPDCTLEELELRAWSRTRLAAYKVPQHITFVLEFPRTAAGKIQKHLLRSRSRK
jgi:hypothetical protein